MKLIITRHGETEENKQGIMMGHLPGELSILGREQAQKVALRLKNEKIDVIYSSDLARASDTAKEISKFHENIKLIFTKELRERNIGEYQGKKKSDLGWNNKDFKVASIEIKNGESLEELHKRAEKFLEEIIKKHTNKTVLLVGHNAINKALISVLDGKNSEEIKKMENQYNTSINIIEINENGNKLLVFNCTEHLLSS